MQRLRWGTLIILFTSFVFSNAIAPQQARACGGFFCDANTLSPIYQAAERVVFARHNDHVTMHVEIAYEGEPTDFAWMVPLPTLPEDALGNPLPLEQILRTSIPRLFDLLQSATNPTFTVNNTFEDFGCNQANGTSVSGVMDAGSWDESTDPNSEEPGGPPPVAVLQEAEIGPFQAQLITATDSQALFEWLGENGYVQDENAIPILDSYVTGEYLFLGIRLQNGKDTGDIRPIELNLGDTDACVPLRLTAIAATPDMPIMVWVLGDHRAVPKNFLHAEVNPKALQWPQVPNYMETISEAVDTAAGRAFITEYASPAKIMDGAIYNDALASRQASVAEASDIIVLWNQLVALGGVSNPELLSILQSHIPMPEDLRGYPHGNCWYEPSPSEWRREEMEMICEPDEDHVTTTAEFYNFLGYWLAKLEADGKPLAIDLDAIKEDLLRQYFEPRQRIQSMFDQAEWITRLYTLISDSEMTRDPIFAFNPDAPELGRDRTLETVVKSDEDCDESWIEATYDDGSRYIFPCETPSQCMGTPTVGPVPDAPALLHVAVYDESGEPRYFDPADAEEVDVLLDKAVVGQPSLPENYDLSEEPENISVGTNALPSGTTKKSSGCTTTGGTTPISGLVILLVFMLAIGRRRYQA